MTQIRHHLTDDLLMAYSAGNLPEAFSLMVAAHVSMCDLCRAQIESFDAVGGAILEDDVAPVEMSEASFAATMALVEGGLPEPLPAPRAHCGVLPQPLQDYVGGSVHDINWRSVGMGVKQAILPVGDGEASARLLYIPAGTAVPDHGHKGTEITMVLKGAFSDQLDRFQRGDVEIAGEDLHHTPVADISEDCICLAVTDAPLKFNKLLPRLAQPFFRI